MILYYVLRTTRSGRIIRTGYRRRSRAERAALAGWPATRWVDAKGRKVADFLSLWDVRAMQFAARNRRSPHELRADVEEWVGE